jgi:hypothetical protein
METVNVQCAIEREIKPVSGIKLLTDITIERLPWIIWMGPTRSQKVFKMEE